ncbi:MAG: rod shape-determining protein RodA [Bacteroidales bacterium]|nr:rod shape-determining protein RodA [Bacteroidales bacterium]
MKRNINILESIDWLTIGIYLLLVIFGWINIFAVGYNDQFKNIFDLKYNYGTQLIWILASFALIFIIFILDHKVFPFFSYLLYGLSILMLVAVFLFGTEVHGAKSWFRIAGFSIQPSEFAKIGTSLALAKYLSGYNITKFTFKTFAVCSAIIGMPFFLILIQPDPGTAMVFIVFLLVLYREGLPGWILLMAAFISGLFLFSLLIDIPNIVTGLIVLALIAHYAINRRFRVFLISVLICAAIFMAAFYANQYFKLGYQKGLVVIVALTVSGLICLILALRYKIRHVLLTLTLLYGFIAIPYSVDFVFHRVLKPHQQKRVNILLGKELDPKGYGYNVNQSKIAIGSGGFSGKGFLEGTQTKFNFVPEQSTDFIFCTVGEEWGFIGTSLVILLFTGLLIRIVFIAERQRTRYVRIYAYLVVSVLFIHFAINTAMTIGLFPVIGIPLPFFSYGGSSMMAFSILLFILMRLDAVRMVYL